MIATWQTMGAEAPAPAPKTAPKTAAPTAASITGAWVSVGDRIAQSANNFLLSLQSMSMTRREHEAAIAAQKTGAAGTAAAQQINWPMVAMIGAPVAIVGVALLAKRR